MPPSLCVCVCVCVTMGTEAIKQFGSSKHLVGFAFSRHRVCLGGDGLDGTHEDVRNNGDAEEAVKHSEKIKESAGSPAPCVLGRDQDEAGK